MSDLAAMARRLDELDQTVRQLKRRRAGGLALVAAGCLIGWLVRWAMEPAVVHAQGGQQDLVVRSLKIVNGDNRTVLLLDADKDGGFIRLGGHDGVERSFLGVADNKGGGLLYLRNADGKAAPAVLSVADKGGYLSLNNTAAQKRSVWLGTDLEETGGAVFLYDRQGNLRCDIGVTPGGGMLNLYGANKGKSHVYLGTGSKSWGGLLLLRDTDGQTRVELGQGKAGGYVNLSGNKNNQVNFSVATSDDERGSYLQVRDAEGKARVELGINDGGSGYIDDFKK